MNNNDIENYKNDIVEIIKDKSLSVNEKWNKINLLEYIESSEIYKAEVQAQNDELLDNEKHLYSKTIKLEKLFNNIPLAIIQLDEKLNIVKFNNEADKLLGIKKFFSIKKLLPLFLKKDTLAEFYRAINLASTTSKSKITLKLFDNFDEKTIEFNIIEYPDTDNIGYLISLIDLTEEIEKTDKLQKTTKKLYENEAEKVDNYIQTITSMVELIEKRDFYTGGHSSRVANYAVQIAVELGLDSNDVFMLKQIGLLHDIGKIAIPDSILLKPGKLSEQEHNIIKSHVEVGYSIISKIPMFKDFSEIILCHHERYDGSGYPNGLKGDEIPILAQVLAIADTFDAMTTTRIYNKKKSIANAILNIKKESGKLFNPSIMNTAVKVFEKVNMSSHKTQLPQSDIDKERFAYYFKDVLTDSSNEEYLKLLFEQNKDNYKCLNLLLIHNFSKYNEKYGWNEGNNLLIQIADLLKVKYKGTELFRFRGVNFVILNKKHIDIELEEFNKYLGKFDLNCELKHFDIENFESAQELLQNLD